MPQNRFFGSITALITPFRDGAVDFKAFADLVEWQITEGTHGLVPCGTTGESPTLTHEEHHQVIDLCIATAKGRVPVIAGCGSNSTREAISLTQHAESASADAALIVTPYYNKPTQEGLYQHYKAIHEASNLPIIIYNIPGRSVINMSVETMARLAELPRIIGVKDATNDLARPVNTRLLCGDDFLQFSGNDDTALAFLAQGGAGCISVVSNIAPALCAAMQNAWRAGDVKLAQKINDRLAVLNELLFVETSPAPVKYVAAKLGFGNGELRLPLVPPTKATQQLLYTALERAGLLAAAQSRKTA